MHDLIVAVGLLRAPIVVAIVTLLVLVVPGQSGEVFKVIAEATGQVWSGAIARVALGTGLLAAVTLACNVMLIANCPPSRLAARKRFGPLLEAIALSLPALPLVATLLVVGGNRWWPVSVVPEPYRDTVLIALSLGATAAILVVASGLAGARHWMLTALLRLLGPLQTLSLPAGLSLLLGAIGICSAAAVHAPFATAEAVGPVLTIFVFLTLVVIGSSLLTFVYDRHQFPVLLLLVSLAFLWSHLGLNNNHQIRLVPAEDLPLDAAEAFRQWLDERPDLADYSGRHYPVYIVTAEGGGMYAAAHAATTLARLQDGCPRFATHVFAISGVSGGSLGAAVFAGLVDAIGPKPGEPLPTDCDLKVDRSGPMREAVKYYFRRDLLTPLLAATLFPDALQRVLPKPVADFDRARALETSFEVAWQRTIAWLRKSEAILRTDKDDFFNRSTRKAWFPMGHVPAMLLNSTVIQTGDRLVMAPFTLKSPPGYLPAFRDLRIDELNKDNVVRVSTAVAGSARFPFITPPAVHWYRLQHSANLSQLVDGGFHDNSGMRTAVDLIARIRQAKLVDDAFSPEAAIADDSNCVLQSEILVRAASEVRRVCFKILVIRSYQVPDYATLRSGLHGEILSPMMALYESRVGVGLANMNSVRRMYCSSPDCGNDGEGIDDYIYATILNTKLLPLGWYLSRQSLEQIDRRGRTAECEASSGGMYEGYFAMLDACLRMRVERDLTGHKEVKDGVEP